MFKAVITAIASFAATNIDDIFILMILFAREERPGFKKFIVAGRYLGICVLILLSLVGGYLLQALPDKYIGLLGLIPIALGIREWVSYRRSKKDGNTQEETELEGGILTDDGKVKTSRWLKKIIRPELFQVTLLALSNGADNIGVYTPLFAGFTAVEVTIVIAVFLLMTALWCFVGAKLAALPVLKTAIRRYKHILVPAVLIVLGLYILLSSGLF